MCTEFFLALLYFSILFCVNFFLFQVVKKNWNQIAFFLKQIPLFKYLKKKKPNKNFFLLFQFSNKDIDIKNFFLFNKSEMFVKKEDIFFLGNLYKFCYFSLKQNKNKERLYFFLVGNQYLSSQFGSPGN